VSGKIVLQHGKLRSEYNHEGIQDMKPYSMGTAFLAAALLGSIACSKVEDGKPVATDTAIVPGIAIDTGIPTIMGYAVKLPGSWCLVTSRRDMWNGKPVNLILMKEHKIHSAWVRDTLPSCAPVDSTPGTLSFALEMKYPASDTAGTIGVVLRDDTWGGLGRRTFIYETNLDGIEGKEFVQECVGASTLNLFATSDSANGPIRWQHKVSLREEFAEGRPHCDGRLGEPRAPAQAVAEAPARPMGRIVFPDTRIVDPSVSRYDMKAIRRVGDQLEVIEAAARDIITEPACPGGVAGHGLFPQVSGEWVVMIQGVYPVAERTVRPARIVGAGPRRLVGDSVVVLGDGPPLMIRSERVGEAGFALYTEVMGARSTLYESSFMPAGSWQVPIALDYDGDNAPDVLVTITSASGKESYFYISTQRQLMGGKWPASAQLTVPAC
jgi:hypothetical protein